MLLPVTVAVTVTVSRSQRSECASRLCCICHCSHRNRATYHQDRDCPPVMMDLWTTLKLSVAETVAVRTITALYPTS
jgi:hypothetical protein